jgi:rubredoxin
VGCSQFTVFAKIFATVVLPVPLVPVNRYAWPIRFARKYHCTACDYVYDPAKGDPESGIAPGTAFEDIPDDWVCPVCGLYKDSFKIVEEK